MLQVVTGTFPCGQQLLKYGCKRTAVCTLCQKAHEERGSSWNGELSKETIGHVQSAGCLGQKEVVNAGHNACIRELLQEVNDDDVFYCYFRNKNSYGKADRHMKLLMIEKEEVLFIGTQFSNLSTAVDTSAVAAQTYSRLTPGATSALTVSSTLPPLPLLALRALPFHLPPPPRFLLYTPYVIT
jgi:hypothetical protein